MKIAYLECFSGMSGDMFMGALVDAGISSELLTRMVESLHLGAHLEISKVNRSGVTATKVDVFIHGEKELPREEWAAGKHSHGEAAHTHGHSRSHDSAHGHSHAHEEAHAHEHPHETNPARAAVSATHEHDQAHGRGLKEIKTLIARAAISGRAKQTATAIFEALGAAEAKIHGVDIESVHFHEVGAVDAIVDIVGAAVGAEALGVDEIVCSPLNVGGGTVKCAHGEFPVPVPATVELLAGVPVYSSGIQKELVTPTGAAIVKTLVTRFGTFPAMTIERSGYGAGSRDMVGHPNVVRLVIGEVVAPQGRKPAAVGESGSTTEVAPFPVSMDTRSAVAQHTHAETITVLEANLDDLNPQVFGYLMDRLLEEGALDVFGIPVQMKKNRPGTLLTVLCKPEDADRLTQIVFTESSTLGVRRREEQRLTLARKWVSVATPWGDVRMKIASMNGTITNYAPEYEDCRKIAAEKQIPLKMVMQEAMQAYLKGSR
jgi:uncharacterized protein (TIGR00299 family) protein